MTERILYEGPTLTVNYRQPDADQIVYEFGLGGAGTALLPVDAGNLLAAELAAATDLNTSVLVNDAVPGRGASLSSSAADVVIAGQVYQIDKYYEMEPSSADPSSLAPAQLIRGDQEKWRPLLEEFPELRELHIDRAGNLSIAQIQMRLLKAIHTTEGGLITTSSAIRALDPDIRDTLFSEFEDLGMTETRVDEAAYLRQAPTGIGNLEQYGIFGVEDVTTFRQGVVLSAIGNVGLQLVSAMVADVSGEDGYKVTVFGDNKLVSALRKRDDAESLEIVLGRIIKGFAPGDAIDARFTYSIVGLSGIAAVINYKNTVKAVSAADLIIKARNAEQPRKRDLRRIGIPIGHRQRMPQ